jgi:hypothetical protein
MLVVKAMDRIKHFCYFKSGMTERANALPPLTTTTLQEADMAISHNAHPRRFRKSITADRLRELLHYDPVSGIFTWRVDRGCRPCKGQTAGTPDAQGHLMIRVDYHIYKAHRLAWLYMTGDWPASLIDHADRNPANNKWENLRAATQQTNAWNMRSRMPKSGFRGVRRHRNGFVAYIYEGNRGIYLGSFKTAEAASAAHIAAVKERRGEFACTETYVPPDTGG